MPETVLSTEKIQTGLKDSRLGMKDGWLRRRTRRRLAAYAHAGQCHWVSRRGGVSPPISVGWAQVVVKLQRTGRGITEKDFAWRAR